MFIVRLAVFALIPLLALAQQLSDEVTQSDWQPEGWPGFSDLDFLLKALLTLTLAAVLGAVIGYHPRRRAAADTPEQIDASKAYVMYAVIGAIIGIMVLKFGTVVGFVVFGIGGLIRFRTVMQSASQTGHVIFVTLIGLSSGLDLPHVAVLATVFGFVLIYLLEGRVTYRIEVKALPAERVAEAAIAYRSLLEQQKCRIVSEKKSPAKQRIVFIFRSKQQITRHDLEELFETRIDPALKGAVDWHVD
jgi:hypothetical protein